MMGFSFSLDAIPGAASVFNKLDALQARFLAVPQQVRAAQDKLALVRRALTAKAAPPSALQEGQTLSNTLDAVQSQWRNAAASFDQLKTMRGSSGSGIPSDAIPVAISLITSTGYVLKTVDDTTARVDALGAAYLTPDELQHLPTLNHAAASGGGMSLALVAVLGVGAFLLLRRRRG